MTRNQAHKIRAYIFRKVEAFEHLPYEDAASEIILCRLEHPEDDRAFFHLAYRRLWDLFQGLYNRAIDITMLDRPSNSWTADEVAMAEAVVSYYHRFGWVPTCEAFDIDPENHKAQKLLSYQWGRDRAKTLAGMPRGKRKRVDVTGLPAKEIQARYGLSRTSAWRAAKRGWVTVLINHHNQ